MLTFASEGSLSFQTGYYDENAAGKMVFYRAGAACDFPIILNDLDHIISFLFIYIKLLNVKCNGNYSNSIDRFFLEINQPT